MDISATIKASASASRGRARRSEETKTEMHVHYSQTKQELMQSKIKRCCDHQQEQGNNREGLLMVDLPRRHC